MNETIQTDSNETQFCISLLRQDDGKSYKSAFDFKQFRLFSFVQRLAYECLSQSIDSAKHSPNLVPTATKPDTVQTESMSYGQYLGMIKSQITCAKDIHNALLECSKKIAGKVQPPGIM